MFSLVNHNLIPQSLSWLFPNKQGDKSNPICYRDEEHYTNAFIYKPSLILRQIPSPAPNQQRVQVGISVLYLLKHALGYATSDRTVKHWASVEHHKSLPRCVCHCGRTLPLGRVYQFEWMCIKLSWMMALFYDAFQPVSNSHHYCAAARGPENWRCWVWFGFLCSEVKVKGLFTPGGSQAQDTNGSSRSQRAKKKSTKETFINSSNFSFNPDPNQNDRDMEW